jgi:uncharacterized protein (UPF0264 family)
MNVRSRPRTNLLVSVRSAAEAGDALAGGADLIDVKEPLRGPLGRADFSAIQEVLTVVAGRAPVSVALGELVDWTEGVVPEGVAFVKWGMSNVINPTAETLSPYRKKVGNAEPVLAAYADHARAQSPPPAEVAEIARQLRFRAFLIDTAVKDGSTLLDWLRPSEIRRLRMDLAKTRVQVALAGSLGVNEIRALAPMAPDWIAVRGVVCDGGRAGQVNSALVRQVRDVITEAGTRSIAG